MKHLLAVLVAAALVAAVPVAVKFGLDAKHLRRTLAAQTDTLMVAQTELKSAQDSLGAREKQLGASTSRADSLSQLHARSEKRVEQLSSTISRLTRKVDSLQAEADQSTARISEQANSLADTRHQLAETAESLTAAKVDLDSTTALLAGRMRLIADLQPWYEKWKHDATERNWLEKLFGADKAKTPKIPEPVFPSLTTSVGDSIATDTTAGPRLSAVSPTEPPIPPTAGPWR